MDTASLDQLDYAPASFDVVEGRGIYHGAVLARAAGIAGASACLLPVPWTISRFGSVTACSTTPLMPLASRDRRPGAATDVQYRCHMRDCRATLRS